LVNDAATPGMPPPNAAQRRTEGFDMNVGTIFLIAIIVLVAFILLRAVRIIPQASNGIVERLGRYHRTLQPGLNFVLPILDRVRQRVDMREQVVSFPPQPVITQENVTISIDTVIYFQITDPVRSTYEIADLMLAMEQLTVTTLRNLIGSITLEGALTSRDTINAELRAVLDEATGKWGVRVNRVELKSIDPPATIQAAMEKQMRAERDRRATILLAEGDKQGAILRAEGEAQAIDSVFSSIHAGDPNEQLLAYTYLQQLPLIADGRATKLLMVPSDAIASMGSLSALGSAFGFLNESQGEQGPSRREQEEQAQQREALLRQQEVERQRGPDENEA
jgi:regulator of protease activity HflC (stomatin/prohibitin superfamily)